MDWKWSIDTKETEVLVVGNQVIARLWEDRSYLVYGSQGEVIANGTGASYGGAKREILEELGQ